MLNEKDIELLEAYTYGDITPQQEAGLQARLNQDTDFAADVRQWELIEREGFVVEPTPATRDAVRAALERHEATLPEKKVSRPWWQYILGLLLLTLLAFAAWKWIGQPADQETTTPATEQTETNSVYADLAKEYFRHLPSENFHLGSEETLEERALAAYEARDYETALPLLLETVEMGGDSLNLLYAGVAALGSGRSKETVRSIDALFQNENLHDYYVAAGFIKALAYLEQGQIEMAENIIEEYEGNEEFPYTELKKQIYDRK